jgi:hypothetical protein
LNYSSNAMPTSPVQTLLLANQKDSQVSPANGDFYTVNSTAIQNCRNSDLQHSLSPMMRARYMDKRRINLQASYKFTDTLNLTNIVHSEEEPKSQMVRRVEPSTLMTIKQSRNTSALGGTAKVVRLNTKRLELRPDSSLE